MRVMLAAFAVAMVGFALTPGSLEAGFAELTKPIDNPIGLPLAWKEAIETITTGAGLILAAGALLSVVSLIQRYRRAAQLERQQIRWLAFLGVFLGMILVLSFGLIATGAIDDEGVVSGLAFFAFVFGVFLGIPAVCGIAILRHGLWDLDVVIRKTVQYGLLVAGFMIVVGLVIFLAPLAVVGVGGSVDLPTIVVAVLLAIGFTVVRSRARRWANRIVYGKRSTPYEVLSEFAERVGETYSMEDVLPRMAQLLGNATGARTARVWLRIGNELRAETSWPVDAPAAASVTVQGDELPTFDGEDAFEVRHQGDLLGALTVAPTPADPMNPTKAKLVRDMAAQAGLVLRNVRLIEDLRESRRRIVAAQDVRAKKLERDIHDGAQQQLVALAVKLRLADAMIDRDPARAARDDGGAAARHGDRARGPPRPGPRDLSAAPRGQGPRGGARTRRRGRSAVPVEVRPDGIGRYSQEVESAVYFSCLEALQNVAKYAEATRATLTLRSRERRPRRSR